MATPFIMRDLVNDDSSLRVSDYAAHVLQWTPRSQAARLHGEFDNPSVIWQPSSIYLAENTAIRGGIPVIFPWFSNGYIHGADAQLQPKHGLGRVNYWTYSSSSDAHHLQYTLSSADIAQDYPSTFGQFHAQYDIYFDEDLRLELSVFNDNDTAVDFEMALHTYFHVSHVRDIGINGLEGATYTDATDNFAVHTQDERSLRIAGEVDRIYDSIKDIVIVDPSFKRSIHISTHGTTNTVVWNPSVSGDAIPDMQPGEWTQFVCVEASACKEGALSIPPHANHTISQRISTSF
ncbi:D-hexose-6-phosphate mutarotase [Alloscardovia criceti]|uniref:D-hexose-6-phosphate mutarotase n=1 Tax=Alloscardovia criceti TaxID=356828 RepID=UPI00037EC58B|nr:hypothetical protein [Alloscardovia criceti]